MKDRRYTGILLTTMALALSLGLASCDRSQSAVGVSAAPQPQRPAPAQSDVAQQRKGAEQQVRPDIEKQRKDAEQEAQQNLDSEAVVAIGETRKAIAALADGKTDEAIAAIERATGKVDVLLARNPATALIDVGYAVEVVDAAPVDLQAIKGRAKAAELAVDAKDYPAARVLLDGLTS
jgi:YfdX protein